MKRRTYSRRTRFTKKGQSHISVTRRVYVGNFTPSTVTTQGFWQYRSVSLNNAFINADGTGMTGLTNLQEYLNLFDLYKLSAFKLEFRPRTVDITQVQNATTTTIELPYVSIIKDATSTVSPTGSYSAATLNTFLENGHVKTLRADRKFSVYMKPKVKEEYGAGSTRFVSPKWTQLNTTGMNMQHNGFHMFFHSQNMNVGMPSLDVFVTYYLQFKGAR